jgi:hypothetical protein
MEPGVPADPPPEPALHVPDPAGLILLHAVGTALTFLTDPTTSRVRVTMVMGWDPLGLHPEGIRAALASLTEGPHGAERAVPVLELWHMLYALHAYQASRGRRGSCSVEIDVASTAALRAFEGAGGTWAPAHAVALARYEREVRP